MRTDYTYSMPSIFSITLKRHYSQSSYNLKGHAAGWTLLITASPLGRLIR